MCPMIEAVNGMRPSTRFETMVDPTEHPANQTPEPHADPRAEPSAEPVAEPDSEAAAAKRAVRANMRDRLAALGEDERHRASGAACARLMNLDAFRQASTVMLYMPLATEVDTTPVAIRCFQTGKSVCVPRVDWKRKDMHAVDVRSFDDNFMEIDEHGLRTPRDGHLVPHSMIDLIVVPALAFDTEGNRLGRGGGFYDRFLSRLRRSATSIGLAFDVQITDNLPVEDLDVRVNGVVTDRRVSGLPSRSTT
jgi:5-formyltetrahydrofolate cyclo-ligase